MTNEDNTKTKKKLLDNFRPVRWKKYEAEKTEIKNLEAELEAQSKGQQSQEEKAQPPKNKDKKRKGIRKGLSTVFRTVRKSSYDKKKDELKNLKNSQSTEQPNNTETVASSSNTASTASTPQKQQERERERAKPKTLKIDPTPSTSTTNWLNSPTPKNDKKFSFHSKEPTEETIVGENPEDFITEPNDLETKSSKDKQKPIEQVELDAENQELRNKLSQLKKQLENALKGSKESEAEFSQWLTGNRFCLDWAHKNIETLIAERNDTRIQLRQLEAEKNNLETTAQIYYNYAEPEIQRLEAQFANSKHNYNNLLNEIEANQKQIRDLQAQLDYEKNLTQDQEKKYLEQIRIKNEAVRLAQEQLDDLQAQIFQLRLNNLRNNSRRENNLTEFSNLSPLLSNKPSDLSSYESQSDEKSSDEEAGETSALQSSQNKLYDLEKQETITEGYRKRLKEAINNQVKKAQNYLGESYRNHPRTYQAIGLTALGAGAAYYNWETLTEYLNPQQVQGALTSLSDYSSQAVATISSTALTYLPSFSLNLNKPNQVENNLNLNWTNQTSSFDPPLPDFYEQILNGNCPANLIVDNQNLNKSSRTSSANTRSNIKDKKQKKNCQKNRSTSQSLNAFFNERSWLANQNPSLENFEAAKNNPPSTYPEISELSELNEINQTSLEPVNNQTLTNQFQKLNELEKNLFNLGMSANEINNISDRKTLFKYHPDKALINGLSAEKANEIFKNLSAYRSQLENFTSEAPNLLENSTNQQPDKLMNESQINFSPNGNPTETPFESSSIPLDYNSILGGSILIVGAGQLLAKYEAKQQENQIREKAAVKIQSLVRMHQVQQKIKREKERLAQEKAAHEAQRQRQEHPNYESYEWKTNKNNSQNQPNNPSPSTPPTNSHEEKTPNQNDNVPSPGSENTSTPGGGDYYSGGTITTANFSSSSPSQLIQDILNQAQKAIESQKIPPLETAEKQIVSLFEEKDPSKKQVYYQYQTQLENKLEKVIQTKIIQEIQVNHLDIAKQIKGTIEPQKIQNKEWKAVINQLTIEKIPSVKKQIQNDILRQTKQAATEILEADLKLAQLIKRDIQPEENWKLIIKNAPSEKDIKQEWEKNKQSLLAQSQEAVINNLNSLLGSELKIADLDQPFSEFPKQVYQKKLTALKAYQHQAASHIAEKKRNYSQMAQLNTIAQPESKWKNLILPLTVGGVGMIAGILAWKYWLNAPKSVNKNSPPSSHPSTKIKLLIERYLTNLKKLQKNGYKVELAQTIQQDFQQIQVLMEEWLGKQKNKFEEKNWSDFQRKYGEYLGS